MKTSPTDTDNKPVKAMTDLDKKIKDSIRILHLGAEQAQGRTIELAYSGGKDSDVILQLAREADIDFRPIYKQTTVDPSGTVQHCLSKGVEIARPKDTLLNLIPKHGIPNRARRWCCSIFKERKILDDCIMGVRRAESTKRARLYHEPLVCRGYGKPRKDGTYNPKNRVNAIYPILYWTTEDVAQFIADRGISCHPLYYDEQGVFHPERRLGCVICPLVSKQAVTYMKQHPKWVKTIIRKEAERQKLTPPLPDSENLTPHEAFMITYFYKEFNAGKQAEKGLFPYRMDCKAILEEFFQIDLTI